MPAQKRPSELDRIAGEMLQMITQTDARWVHRRLSRGLEIVIQRTGSRYRLAIARQGTWPSDDELAVVAKRFNATAAADFPERTTKKFRNPKTDTEITYHVIQIEWTEQPATV